MKALIDKSNIELVVIGESMAGKTTWITSLFSESVNCELRERCLGNNRGQTKIKTYYKIVDSDVKGIRVDYIEFAGAVLKKKLENDEKRKKLQPLYDFGIIEKALENAENAKECDDFVHIDLSNEQIDIGKFFDKIINNKVIAEMDIIRLVCICGPAHEQIYSIMKKIGVETITIRDTRGLMDETNDFYNKRKILQNKAQSTKNIENIENFENSLTELAALLAERGVFGADGCVFITAGGNALNKEELRNRYGFLFEAILDDMPSFLIARSSQLNTFIDNSFSIDKYKEWMRVDESYKFVGQCKRDHSCQDYVKLLSDYGLFDTTKGLKNKVIKKHYKQMLIPLIDTSDEEERTMYLLSAHASFAMIIEELYDYKSELYDLIQKETELPAKLRQVFQKGFQKAFSKSVYYRADGKKDTKVLKKQFVEDVANACICSVYKGGLVGERGGLTTYIAGYGKTGKYAIDLLEAAYNQFNVLVDLFSKNNFDEEDIKIRIYEYLKLICNQYAFSYACTNKMINTSFLYDAWLGLQGNKNIINNFANDYDNSIALDIVYNMLSNIIIGMLDAAEKAGKHVDFS